MIGWIAIKFDWVVHIPIRMTCNNNYVTACRELRLANFIKLQPLQSSRNLGLMVPVQAGPPHTFKPIHFMAIIRWANTLSTHNDFPESPCFWWWTLTARQHSRRFRCPLSLHYRHIELTLSTTLACGETSQEDNYHRWEENKKWFSCCESEPRRVPWPPEPSERCCFSVTFWTRRNTFHNKELQNDFSWSCTAVALLKY